MKAARPGAYINEETDSGGFPGDREIGDGIGWARAGIGLGRVLEFGVTGGDSRIGAKPVVLRATISMFLNVIEMSL